MSTAAALASRPSAPHLPARGWAARPAAGSGPEVLLIPPPYQAPSYLRESPAGGRELPLGSVLALSVFGSRVDWEQLETALQRVRARYPFCPVVLQVDPGAEDLLFIIARASRLPVRGVLLRGVPIAPVLRRHLSQPFCLADDVVEWLSLRGVRMAPALSHLIRQIFARAPFHHDLSSLCREIGLVESSARFRCHKKGLPAPSRWLHAARALHAALRLQAEPDKPLLSLALELGYADHSALSHQVQRAFGLRPGPVRALLGWEWLMTRWLESHAPRERERRGRTIAAAKRAAG